VEDRPDATEKTFSWWDIQDGNAKLPVKQASQYELRKLLFPTKSPVTTTESATKAAKGAFKMMNKMANAVVGDDSGESTGPPVAVLTFKLLDLVKIGDDLIGKPTPAPRPTRAVKSTPRAKALAAARPRPAAARAPQPRPAGRSAPKQQEASLLDFGGSPAKPTSRKTAAPANETRAQRLKREQEQRMKTQNRVWDDIDQRWVEAKPTAAAARGPAAAATKPKAKVVGVKLDGSSAVGKSANVQAAVNKRVNDMRESQQKALKEVREREAKKKREEDEEDVVRRQLEPKIKAWSEEHGKKKQIRALLATLHTILWPGTKWKQVSIGDLLDDKKVKRSFHKATLVVHPDKTHDLPANQRFLAKRIFDALSQAKTEFDNGS
jgi:hypothetical protein